MFGHAMLHGECELTYKLEDLGAHLAPICCQVTCSEYNSTQWRGVNE